MPKNFSITEEQQQNIIAHYRDTLEKTAEAAKLFATNINELCEQTRYQEFVNIGIACVDFYTNDLKQGVEQVFDNWAEGNNNLRSFIANVKGGEAAELTAITLQNGLKDTIADMFPQIEPPSPDTSEPDFKEDDFDTLKEHTDKYISSLEEIKTESLRIVEDGIEENALYSCIREPIVSTLKIVSSSFEEVKIHVEKSKELLDEAIDQDINNSEAAAAEAEKTAEATAKTLFEGLEGFDF